MIALLVALAISNMPPPPPNLCKKAAAGTPCLTDRRREGVCVDAQCPKTEMNADGAKTVRVDCRVCQQPDGGTK